MAHGELDEAAESGVDAVAVGVEYHRPLSLFAPGRLPARVLEHAPTPVWLIRCPAPEAPG